ncbi:transmembrane protein KIAA1109 [Trichonephila clavipes]|nr:transmembrane protein KIAA1109 [Trichonephila clavipes]
MATSINKTAVFGVKLIHMCMSKHRYIQKNSLFGALYGLVESFFKNDEGHNVTVNGDRYRAMITNFFIPELNNHDVQELWFQQDGATCHTARATIDLLKDTFGDRLISRFGPVNWPPRSCDLTSLDYFLWGYVKSLVYADKLQTLDHLEDNIRRVIANIRPQMLEKVIENLTSRLDYIRASRAVLCQKSYLKSICDIGSASFKYDMRRLTEILAFPKAWYRRSIARRMFLGDQSTGALYSDQEDSVETSSSSGTMSPSISKADYIAFSSPVNVQSSSSGLTTSMATDGVSLCTVSTKLPHNVKNVVSSESIKDSNKPLRPLLSSHGHRDRLWLNLDRTIQESKRGADIRSPSKSASSSYDEGKDSLSSGHSSPLHSSRHSSSWETLVLFAVNLSRLNVHMNMGNVMGNTTWLTRDFKSQGRLSIGSNGHKNLFLSIGLEGSTLDSKGGIVGGTIELSRIDTCMHLKEDWGQEPDHTVALKLGALESRLDYMGTSVLMGRVSSLDITLKDEWRVSSILNQDHISSHPTKRPALIFVNGELSWDQLQLLISKSTTPDLIKMYSKLEEFFSQQFHSSKRVFSSLQPRLQRHSLKNRSRKSKSSEETEAKHHRHWQKVLSVVSGLQLSTMASALPDMGTILGGTMDLHGYNISLACFHGINFRSKAWAIFSMRKPTISFATEAQDVVKDDGSIATHIVQNLSYALGSSSTETAQHASMATVCRISRNVLFPPQFRSMHEWFHYAFATSELDDVGRFPVLEHDRENTNDRRVSMPTKGPEFNHNMEVIFALPSMQLHLKTEHLQPARPISTGGPKPTVDCSFVTEFDDHIFVAVDAEAFFFLHDLITSYIKEKENSDRKLKMADPTDSLQKDWRSYQCHTWHLEPTVRLLSWAGKGIEPYGVDYILQKLGFAHARVTIPKWMQRGCMDPLDKILAVVMEKMISAVKDDKDDAGVNVKKL